MAPVQGDPRHPATRTFRAALCALALLAALPGAQADAQSDDKDTKKT